MKRPDFDAAYGLYRTKEAYLRKVGVPDCGKLEGKELLAAIKEYGITFEDYNRAAPALYCCNECGNGFYTHTRSIYDQQPKCPCCGVDDMYTVKHGV